MIFIKCIILFLIFVVAPFLLGEFICYKDFSGLTDTFVAKYILGLFMSFSMFWILCVPMTLLKISFTILTVLYSVILFLLCGIGVYLFYKNSTFKILLEYWKTWKIKWFEFLYLILFLAFLGIQLYFAFFYESTIWSTDDCEYVVRALDTITSDHMYLTNIFTGAGSGFDYKRILNSWEIYTAYLAKVSGFHVTTIAHTVMPAVFLVIAYLVYIYISYQLFDSVENKLIFLCLLSVVLMFGFYSPYSLTFRLVVTLWQGKAILSAIVIPFLISFLPRVYGQKICIRTVMYLLLISVTACSLTMMGSGMSIAVYSSMLIVMLLYKQNLAGIWYCIFGCFIPAAQLVLYLIMR